LDQDNANRTDVDGLYYVSRADAATRRVANEDEVAACLSSRGFEILTLDGMPFGEQVALFDRARIVIGPHGSGLTNILFSAGNLTLIELMPDDAVNHCFWLLASALGQNYTFLPGRTINTDRDFLVPVTHLVKAVEQALKSTI
jgi:capsular polysaccharide biosynthesis protein